MEFRGGLGAALSCHYKLSKIEFYIVYWSVWQSRLGPEGHMRKKKKTSTKKKPGAGKNTSACEKGPEGADKTPPPQIRKARGVPVTRWQPKDAVKIPEMEGTNPPRKKRFPWPSLGRGAGVITRCSAHFG